MQRTTVNGSGNRNKLPFSSVSVLPLRGNLSHLLKHFSSYQALDALPGHLYTPFNGPVPPSNLLDQIARRVLKAHEPLEWPHSIRATRTKLAEIARTSDKENMTIDEADEEEVYVTGNEAAQALKPNRPIPKRTMCRQSSMDFLPARDKTSGSLLRLQLSLSLFRHKLIASSLDSLLVFNEQIVSFLPITRMPDLRLAHLLPTL